MSTTQRYMLSTVDNPYDPYTHYTEWDAWDCKAGYFTSSFLARVVVFSDELSSADQALAIERAIDEIVEYNVLGVYRKVYPKTRSSEPS